jgi:hypothetical protein
MEKERPVIVVRRDRLVVRQKSNTRNIVSVFNLSVSPSKNGFQMDEFYLFTYYTSDHEYCLFDYGVVFEACLFVGELLVAWILVTV